MSPELLLAQSRVALDEWIERVKADVLGEPILEDRLEHKTKARVIGLRARAGQRTIAEIEANGDEVNALVRRGAQDR